MASDGAGSQKSNPYPEQASFAATERHCRRIREVDAAGRENFGDAPEAAAASEFVCDAKEGQLTAKNFPFHRHNFQNWNFMPTAIDSFLTFSAFFLD
jgi:hypothetical protein